MASTDASPSTASATDGDEVPSLTKGIEQLLLDAEAMPRLAWDTPDVDLKPEDVRKLGFTPEDWSAANTAFKPICLMVRCCCCCCCFFSCLSVAVVVSLSLCRCHCVAVSLCRCVTVAVAAEGWHSGVELGLGLTPFVCR